MSDGSIFSFQVSAVLERYREGFVPVCSSPDEQKYWAGEVMCIDSKPAFNNAFHEVVMEL